MIRSRDRSKGGQRSGDISIASVAPGAIFDIDATVADSYPGSGDVIYNLVKSPADGELQSTYNWNLGAAAGSAPSDPTFVGTAGSPSAYFLLDGTQQLILLNITNYIAKLHRSDNANPWWCVLIYQVPATASTRHVYGNSNTATRIGFRFTHTSTPQTQYIASNGASAVSMTAVNPSVINSPYLFAFTITPSTSAAFAAGNSTTFTSRTVPAFTSTDDSTSTIGFGGASTVSGSSILENGSRLYAASMGLGVLNNDNLAAIVAMYNTRHGRTYA